MTHGNKPAESAARAAAALEAYPLAIQRPVDLMTDFLPDLMHWCAAHGIDWDEQIKLAADNFKAEAVA